MSWESTITYYQVLNETIKQALGGLHSAKCILYSVDFEEIEKCQANGDWNRSAEILSDAAQSLEKAGADYIVLLSKYPVLWQDTIPYGSSSNQRVAYMLDIKGTNTLVVNNHFESNGLSSGDKEGFKTLVKGKLKTGEAKRQSVHLITKLGNVSTRRAPQAETVARYVKKYLDKKVPVILCGDFNDSPLSYTHRTIAKELNDCFVESGNGPGISYHKSGMYFRIDHIFCSDDFESYGAKVDNSVTTSDHYPIYCWLKYRPKP